MSTTTLERPATITEAAPLTVAEQDTLIGMTAAAERPKVRRPLSTGVRAWSMGGNVD